MGIKLEIYPACLDCAWRELTINTVYGSMGCRDVEMCEKAPVCKLIDGQRQLVAEDEKEDGRCRE